MNTSIKDIARLEFRHLLGLVELEARIGYIYNAVGSISLALKELTPDKRTRPPSTVSVMVMGRMRYDMAAASREVGSPFEVWRTPPKVPRLYVEGKQSRVGAGQSRTIILTSQVTLYDVSAFVMADVDCVHVERIVLGTDVIARRSPVVTFDQWEAGWQLTVDVVGVP